MHVYSQYNLYAQKTLLQLLHYRTLSTIAAEVRSYSNIFCVTKIICAFIQFLRTSSCGTRVVWRTLHDYLHYAKVYSSFMILSLLQFHAIATA